MPGIFFTRLSQALSSGGEGRFDIWTAGLEAWKHYPIMGAGFFNTKVLYSAFAGYAPHFVGFGRDSHNIFLGVAMELGLVGVVLLGIPLFHEFRAAIHCRRLQTPSPLLTSLEAACWATLVSSFFANILCFKSFWLSFVLLNLALRYSKQGLKNGRMQASRTIANGFAITNSV
jgi:O-antigen ligase